MKDLSSQLRPLIDAIKPLGRHLFFVTIIVGLGFLIYAVYATNETLQNTTDDEYRASKEASGLKTTFDQETIEKIRSLKEAGDSDGNLPDRKRDSPFVE